MASEGYDAFIETSALQARAAAQAMAAHEQRFGRIENDLVALKWMATTNIALTLVVLGKLFLGH